jgi:hypothetical protein
MDTGALETRLQRVLRRVAFAERTEHGAGSARDSPVAKYGAPEPFSTRKTWMRYVACSSGPKSKTTSHVASSAAASVMCCVKTTRDQSIRPPA